MLRETEIRMDVITVMGVLVHCFLDRVVEDSRVYFNVVIENEGQLVFCSEEKALKIYEDCKVRAMKGPVDGKYLFLSDKDREDALHKC